VTRKLLVGAIVAGALAVTAGTAFALTGGGETTTPSTAPTSASPTSSTSGTSAPDDDTEVSADDAAGIAQARYGGTVHEVEREREHGRLEWKVEVTADDGKAYDVRVDAQSGEITRVDQDDDHDDQDDNDDD
jgi:uncharacterized membrane protein YkoI